VLISPVVIFAYPGMVQKYICTRMISNPFMDWSNCPGIISSLFELLHVNANNGPQFIAIPRARKLQTENNRTNGIYFLYAAVHESSDDLFPSLWFASGGYQVITADGEDGNERLQMPFSSCKSMPNWFKILKKGRPKKNSSRSRLK